MVTLCQLFLADGTFVVGFDACHDAMLVEDMSTFSHLLLLLQRIKADGARVAGPLENTAVVQ